MQRLCVFCGSSPGSQPAYTAAARDLGKALADSGIALVYGGGNVGMMGQIADAVLKNGGEVTGVIPRAIADMEVAHTALADLRIVESMHARKALMADLSDGFIGLPGGLGTLEEFMEVLTWAQLGFHQKPCGLLNVQGYFDSFLGFIDHVADQQFIQPAHRELILVAEKPAALIEKFTYYRPFKVDKAAWALEMKSAFDN
jgi:uncharacterized protein (TIGR00730 family)